MRQLTVLRDSTGRGIQGILAAALVGALALTLSIAPGPAAGELSADTTREEFIRSAEPVCARDTRRNARILEGVKEQVRKGNLRPASRRFALATRAFTQTLRTVLGMPRPVEDRRILNRWFGYLLKQRSFLAQISRALAKGQGYESQRLSLFLIRNASHANQAVRGYGFNHCLIRPNRFL